MEIKEVVLKSANPLEYGDEVVHCRVIQNVDINAYLDTIPGDREIIATKIAPISARTGVVGEEVHTVLYTYRNGKKYVLSEENSIVKERDMGDETKKPDIVVTNIQSTSNEQYVVKANKFAQMYAPNSDGTFTPNPDERLLSQVDEDIIIITAWGSEAVCLAGSYIVTYNADENDFNTIEQGAYESTYAASNAKTL